MIVDKDCSTASGISIFAVDPGETTGWAWACLGWSELRRSGVGGAISSAQRHRSGTLLGDARFMCGEISSSAVSVPGASTALVVQEACAAASLLDMMDVCGSMSDRVSNDLVPGISVVVVEDFVLRKFNASRSLLSPVRITSAFGTLLHNHRLIVEWCVQSPSDKSVINDERLKELGLWQAGQPHARDACRHLILHLRRVLAQPRVK
jgi:hypothetical protein